MPLIYNAKCILLDEELEELDRYLQQLEEEEEEAEAPEAEALRALMYVCVYERMRRDIETRINS